MKKRTLLKISSVGWLVVCLFGIGCSSLTPPPLADVEVARADAQTRAEFAPPAARDALLAGLDWIALDATSIEVTARNSEKPLNHDLADRILAHQDATIDDALIELASYRVEVPAP